MPHLHALRLTSGSVLLTTVLYATQLICQKTFPEGWVLRRVDECGESFGSFY